MQCSLNSIATGPLSGAERAGEPETGATVFRHPQTHPDPVRQFPQVNGSPFDSLRRRSTDRIRMACKRSGVRIPIAPLCGVAPVQGCAESPVPTPGRTWPGDCFNDRATSEIYALAPLDAFPI